MLDKCCISINARCNIACKYCHFYENDSLERTKIQPLNKIKLLKILHQILTYSNENLLEKFTIGFAGGGEPLLDKEILLESIEEIHKKDTKTRLYFYIITNGILANETFLEKYKRFTSFSHLVFSLDDDEQTHDYARVAKGGQGTHKQIMKNILLYKKIFGEMPTINTTVGKITLENKEKILDFFNQHHFSNITFTRLFHCKDKIQEINQEEFSQFVHFFTQPNIKIRNLEAIKQNKLDCIMYGNKCGVGHNNIFYFNDKVYPCMRFTENEKFALGDYDDTLESIQNRMNKLIKPVKECYYEEY